MHLGLHLRSRLRPQINFFVMKLTCLTQRGALWASGAAQAAQVVSNILRFCGELLGLRGGCHRLEKPDFFQLTKTR